MQFEICEQLFLPKLCAGTWKLPVIFCGGENQILVPKANESWFNIHLAETRTIVWCNMLSRGITVIVKTTPCRPDGPSHYLQYCLTVTRVLTDKLMQFWVLCVPSFSKKLQALVMSGKLTIP